MHRDRDFDLRESSPWNAQALTQDLELDTLLHAMSGDDEFLLEVTRGMLLTGFQNDLDTIRYRQAVLKDCLKNPAVIGELYDCTVEAIGSAKREWWGMSSHYPTSMLHSAVNLLETSMDRLRKLRLIAEGHGARFESEGFTALFAMVRKELAEEYLSVIQSHLAELKFRKGVLMSAELGDGNEGTSYALLQARKKNSTWLERILGKGPRSYTFQIAARDEAGARILSEMEHRAISRVAVALAESADHVQSFFKTLRTELAFYVACLNLHGRLRSKGEPLCFPSPAPAGERRRDFEGLYDVCLSLRLESRAVGNTVDAAGRNIIIVTGANQGGKSTFLRSLGLAQIMMQCGMFVGAEAFTAAVSPALYTHYKREEDATMERGKFDEELARLSEIVDHIAPNSLLLLNESFAATNEREGSAIAAQIVGALLEKGIEIVYVTHLYEFASGFAKRRRADALFLRAERNADGSRPFTLIEGQPLETSYGVDLYRKVFETEAGRTKAHGSGAAATPAHRRDICARAEPGSRRGPA
jgi:DNA mismatch repair ATPase MutS